MADAPPVRYAERSIYAAMARLRQELLKAAEAGVAFGTVTITVTVENGQLTRTKSSYEHQQRL